MLGIAFGAFLIGVLLTGALWFIYSHTRKLCHFREACLHDGEGDEGRAPTQPNPLLEGNIAVRAQQSKGRVFAGPRNCFLPRGC